MNLTIVDEVKIDDSLLSEELFGPILPIVEADVRRAVEIISSLPHPLAIYVFASDCKEVKYGIFVSTGVDRGAMVLAADDSLCSARPYEFRWGYGERHATACCGTRGAVRGCW